MTIRILTLNDAAAYQRRLIQRMSASGKATEEDRTMSAYILEIIESRIADKENQQ